MELTPAIQEQLDAVRAGRAVAALEARVLEVSGPDSQGWLNDLVTAGIADLEPGDACESLLLDATGRLKAHFTVARTATESFLLVQPADQRDPVGTLLARYVLSSKVALEDRADELGVHRIGSNVDVADAVCRMQDRVSALAVVPARQGRIPDRAAEGFEAARILDGVPRYPVDFADTSVPAEAGWDAIMVDGTKGCFLGQESVAKIRNRGRPPFLIVAMRSAAPVDTGTPISADGTDAGTVTSSLVGPDATHLVARVRWFDRAQPPEFRTAGGHPLALTT